MPALTRRSALLVSALAMLAPSSAVRARDLLPEPEVGDNGLHKEDWFLQSFLDLGEDLKESQAEGKGLVIFVEQAGCPYCREMYRVNMRIPETVDLIRQNFNVVQLDLRGAREVTDTDGQSMPERDLVRKWGVAFTPTLLFVAKDADPAGKPLNQAVASIMPGYFKPYHFESMFDYVATGSYKTAHFQDYITERRQKLEAAGRDVSIWD